MPENNKKDILRDSVENSYIALISSKVKVLIVGGGRAAFIKTKNFAIRGCGVVVISKDFDETFKIFDKYSKVKLVNNEYITDYIYDAHIVVIATNDDKINDKIRKDCDKINKLYMDCSKPEKGKFIVPCQRASKNFSVAVNVKGKSPKTSVYIADKAKKYLERYEAFIEFTVKIRNKVKGAHKKEIMKFICSDDFYFFYRRNKAELVLKMFYGEDNKIETYNSNEEK